MDETIFYTGNDGLTGALLDGYRAITEAVDPAGLDADLDKIGRTLRMPQNIDRVYRMLARRSEVLLIDPGCTGPLKGITIALYVSDGRPEVTYYPAGSQGASHSGYPCIRIPANLFVSPSFEYLQNPRALLGATQPLYLPWKKDITDRPVPALHMKPDVVKELWYLAWEFAGLNKNQYPCLRTAIKDAVLSAEDGKSA